MMRETVKRLACPPVIARFVRDTRAGATAIAATAITVMTIGAIAFIVDHLWLVNQRDMLKSASDAAAVASTIEMTRQLTRDPDLSDQDFEAALEGVARRYMLLNFHGNLPPGRFETARDTLVIEIAVDRGLGTVDVMSRADLGGTFFARHLPLLGNYTGPERLAAEAGAECATNVVEVVLAIDVTHSMHNHFGDGRRLDVAVDAARALIDVLHAGCEDLAVAIGLVPWDRTVRVAEPDTWARRGWADLGRFPPGRAWAGCLGDRTLDDMNDPRRSEGLSIALPRRAAFPAYLHPDTTLGLHNPFIASVYGELVRGARNEDRTMLQFNAEHFKAQIVALGDNNWDAPLAEYPGRSGGPNAKCTPVPMTALTSDDDAVERALSAVESLAGR